MADARWEQIKEIFQAALETQPGAERERYLNGACAGDDNMRAEVIELLASFDESDNFLEGSAVAEVAEVIAGTRETLAAGQQFGRYRIERKLGAGGMGEVFLAEDTELKRLVALKVLSAAFSDDPDRVRRFVQEARAASALNHPNILTIYEIGQVEDLRFIATEYIEGETLRERHRSGLLAVNEITDIFSQTAAALSAAHAAGIVHRDIKPENIMQRGDGLVKVLDFGLAKLVESSADNSSQFLTDTTPGLVMGTVAYMSPEQARGMPTDARTDIWSLGVCLSEIVFGTQPFTGATTSDRIAAILKSEPELGSKNAPPVLRDIIEKCLDKNADGRYQSVRDFSSDLKNFSRDLEFQSGSEFSFSQPVTAGTAGEFVSRGQQTSGIRYLTSGIKKRRFLSLSAAAIAIAVIASVVYFAYIYGFSQTGPINSLAVLSFINESGDENSEYLSDGLSESLINKLSQLPQLRVASRNSAFKYKGQNIDVSEIARALGVQAIVTGRVVRRGDDLQIGVELINAADNTQIWGETYRRKVADVQAVQEDIAQTVLQKLQLKLSGAEKKHFSDQITGNSQAYQLYLNGVFFRRKNGGENVKRAIEYQKQAVALDPDFALAYAELGSCYSTLIDTNVIEPQTGLPLARAAIEKALNLDDTLAQARYVNADLKKADYDWIGAEAEIQRALELNPNLAAAHTAYADMLSNMGRADESVREIRRAQELDPLRINLVSFEAMILLNARRYDDALVKANSAAPEAKNEIYSLIHRARLASIKGRYDEAFDLLRQSLDKERTFTGLVHLGRTYVLAGNRDEALRTLAKLKVFDGYVSPSELAILYAALGETDQAFAALDEGVVTHDQQILILATAPEYDPLRGNPRFVELLRRINLTSPTLDPK
jgi:serine/threonine-protein kinase